jgi:hypothetical protein
LSRYAFLVRLFFQRLSPLTFAFVLLGVGSSIVSFACGSEAPNDAPPDDEPLAIDSGMLDVSAPPPDVSVADAVVDDAGVIDAGYMDVTSDARLDSASDACASGCGATCATKCAYLGACVTDADCQSGLRCGQQKQCVYPRSCADVPKNTPPGLVQLKPDAFTPVLGAYCANGWALVYSSVGDPAGKTTEFWDIRYADRLTRKGTADPNQNYYDGAIYKVATEYRDEMVDLKDSTFELLYATATSIDLNTMRFNNPKFVRGNADVFAGQFASGWASRDYDGDTYPPQSCALEYVGVTQHYSSCWSYNLGADAEQPYLDGGWGPHVASPVIVSVGAFGDGTVYSRVKRLTRWAAWGTP